MPRSRLTLILLFALLCLIWSTTWAAIRVCEQGFSPLWAASLRFVAAALILTGITWRGLAGRPRIAGWLLPLAGATNALSYALIFLAEQHITGGAAAVLGATNPFFVLGAAAAFGYERVSTRKVFGLVVGFAGVLLLVGAGLGTNKTTAILEVLFSVAILWPTYTVLLRRVGDGGWGALQITGSFIRWTALWLVVGTLLFEREPHFAPTGASVGALAYLALVGTVLAWAVYNFLLQKLPMTVLSTMLFIEPAMALVVDWLLGERLPTPLSWAGSALVLVGVTLTAVGKSGTGMQNPDEVQALAGEPLVESDG
jgi:drug/metabolite transporter (DMT)-like permease